MPETGLYINAVVFMSIQQAQKKPNEGFLCLSDYFVIPQAILNFTSPKLPGRTGAHPI